MGSVKFFKCHAPYDVSPAYAIAVFRGQGARDATSGVVVGLVSTRVSRVTIKLQNGTVETPRLQRWPGFPWAAFASDSTGPNGRFVNSIVLYGTRGGSYENSDIDFFRTPDICDRRPSSCQRPWTNAGDIIDTNPFPITDKAKKIALEYPLVRQLTEGADFVLEPWPWGRPCDGRLFGADIVVRLFRPITVDQRLPYTDFREGSSARYLEGSLDVKASNVRMLHVQVDVLRGKVVGIDPTDSEINSDPEISSYRFSKTFRPGPNDGC